MDLEQRLRASLVAPDPGAMFTARVMARVGRGAARRRSSFILIGTVLVVGAAAAMLAWRLFDVQPLPVEVTAIPVASDPEPVAEDTVVNPVARSAPEVQEPVAPVPPPEPAPREISPQYSVLVMPLRQEAQNVAGRGPVEALYSSMLEELRMVPGLTLYVPGESERGAGGQADYVLTITSLATGVSRSGGVVFRSTDGGTTYTVEGGSVNIDYGINEVGDGGGASFFSSGQPGTHDMSVSRVSAGGGVSSFNAGRLGGSGSVLWVEMRVESRQSAASRYTLPVGAEGTAEQPRCNSPNAVRPPECMTPAELAGTQVEILRLQIFPPDAAFQQRVMARLGDTSLDAGKVLQDLLPLLTGDGGSRLDAGTIHAVARYAAGQPADTRANFWRALRRASHPALVAPLVGSLRHDADRQVRLAALANLGANHSTDPVVRSAFEGIDREDPDAIVRAAVRRALYGEVQWRNDVLASLHDTDLPYEARLAPLITRTSAESPQQEGHRRAVLQEQQVLRPLITLVREHLRDTDHAQATGDVLGLLGSVDDPAVFDLFMQLMRETTLPFQMSGPVGSWALNHQNDPRVRENLPLMESMIPSNLLERMREVTGR